MIPTAKLKTVEIVHSNSLRQQSYRVIFDLLDWHGPLFDQRAIVRSPSEEMSTSAEATMTVEIPYRAATEDQAISKAREVLHDALTRLAGAAMTPAA